jgi:hypothetical protein
MEWLPLILAIVTAVTECIEKNRTDDEIKGEFKRPRPLMERFLQHRFRQSNNISRYEWRQKYKEEDAKFRALSPEQQEDIANQYIAKAKNNLANPGSPDDTWVPTVGSVKATDVGYTEE